MEKDFRRNAVGRAKQKCPQPVISNDVKAVGEIRQFPPATPVVSPLQKAAIGGYASPDRSLQ